MGQSHREHGYVVTVTWAGNLGTGTSSYRGYSRAHEISAADKSLILGSSDPAFRGDASRYNPEELLVASLASCHMLWYLHLCADAGIVVTHYADHAHGTMVEGEDGGGHFTSVQLRPQVIVAAGSDLALAERLHEKAHRLCFIANSVNFQVACEAHIEEG